MYSIQAANESKQYVEESESVPRPLDGRMPIHEHFVTKIQQIVAPCFQRLELMKQGRFEEAIRLQPMGIWYNNTFAYALKQLGDTSLDILGPTLPASRIHAMLLDKGCFYTSWANAQFWVRVPDETSHVGLHYTELSVNPKVKASDAIKVLIEKVSFIGCQHIHAIAVYLMMIDRMGNETFDSWAQYQKLDLDLLFTTDFPIFTQSAAELPSYRDRFRTTFLQGQTLYMNNHETYTVKHPHGMDRGMNLVFIDRREDGEPLFTGMGLDPRGVTLEEVAEGLIRAYNQNPIEDETLLSSKAAEKYRTKRDTIVLNTPEGRVSFTQEEFFHAEPGSRAHFFYTAVSHEILANKERLSKLRSHQITKQEFLSRKDLFSSCSTRIGSREFEALVNQTVPSSSGRK